MDYYGKKFAILLEIEDIVKKYQILKKFTVVEFKPRTGNDPYTTIYNNHLRNFGPSVIDVLDKNCVEIGKICHKYSATGIIEIIEDIENVLIDCCEYNKSLASDINPSNICSLVLSYMRIYNLDITVNLNKNNIKTVRIGRRKYLGVGRGKYESIDHVERNAYLLLSCTFSVFWKIVNTLFTKQELEGKSSIHLFINYLGEMRKLYENVRWDKLPLRLQAMFACKKKICKYL